MSIVLPPPATTLSPAQQQKTLAAAKDFEAMALNEMLAPMFATTDGSKGFFGGGAGEETWRPMLINEMAKKIADAGGLGLAQPIYQQMLRLQEAGPGHATPGKAM